MRRHIALAIHNDPRIVRRLSEDFASLGHEHRWARSQEEARALLADTDYCCIFVDLAIPARAKGGIPSVDNGLNLVEEIRANEALRNVPIVATARRRTATPRVVARAMRRGATDFIEKPFPTEGETLCRVLKKAIERGYALREREPLAKPAPSPELAPFKGGEMVFYPDRVELCGVKILGDGGLMRRLLDVLREKNSAGKFVTMSGSRLAKAIEADGGGNAVAGFIYRFRISATKSLRRRGIDCGPQSIIESGGPGYRLSEWITIRDG